LSPVLSPSRDSRLSRIEILSRPRHGVSTWTICTHLDSRDGPQERRRVSPHLRCFTYRTVVCGEGRSCKSASRESRTNAGVRSWSCGLKAHEARRWAKSAPRQDLATSPTPSPGDGVGDACATNAPLSRPGSTAQLRRLLDHLDAGWEGEQVSAVSAGRRRHDQHGIPPGIA